MFKIRWFRNMFGSKTMIKLFILLNSCLLTNCCLPSAGNAFDSKSSINLQSALGGTAVVEEPIKSETLSSIKKQSDLLCMDFNNCRWRSDNAQALKWYRAKGNVDILRLQAITGTNIPPRSPFAVVATPIARVASDAAYLVSNTIPCQEDDGEIRFKYWISPSLQIKVCTRFVGSDKFEYCSLPLYSGSPGPAFVKLRGPIQQNFEVVIVANHFTYNDGTYTGGLAMIDDVEYNGQLCSSTNNNRELLIGKTEEQFKGKNLNVESDSGKVCQLLKCDFSDGLCPHYKPNTVWQIAKGSVGNPVTGIRGDASSQPYNISGEYLFVDGPYTKASLETLPFIISTPNLLKFAYYVAAVDTKFTVLLKKINEENLEVIFESPKAHINSRQWFTERLLLNPAKYEKIVFEANDVKPHTYVGLDEITLLSTDRIPLC